MRCIFVKTPSDYTPSMHTYSPHPPANPPNFRRTSPLYDAQILDMNPLQHFTSKTSQWQLYSRWVCYYPNIYRACIKIISEFLATTEEKTRKTHQLMIIWRKAKQCWTLGMEKYGRHIPTGFDSSRESN